MDVEEQQNRTGVPGDVPQLVPARAQRTYGRKAKPSLISNEEDTADLHLSPLGPSLSEESGVRRGLATSASTFRPSDWRQQLRDIDAASVNSNDEEESRDSPTGLRSQKSRLTDTLSSPSSPDSHPRNDLNRSRSPKAQAGNMVGQIGQYSANTSITSGTSGAVSSSSPESRSQANSSRPVRPGPPPHAESFENQDDRSMASGSDSDGGLSEVERLSKLRRATPDLQKTQSSMARLLPASPFTSPVKSFSKATSQLKSRAPPKFLGADDDDDLDMDATLQASNDAKATREEDEAAWWTDDSSKGKKKRSSHSDEPKNKVKKPTKKDIIEAEKETARMRAEKDLDVQDKAEFKPLTMKDFMVKKLQQAQGQGQGLGPIPNPPRPFSKPAKQDIKTTDPIGSFSSSPHQEPMEEDDSNLDPDKVLDSVRQEMARADAKRSLQRKKIQVIQAHVNMIEDEEDNSDLEIVTVQQVATPLDALGRLNLAAGGKKKPQTHGAPEGRRSRGHELSREEHNRALREQAKKQSTTLMAHKKADFLERGGQLTKQDKAAGARFTDVKELMVKAMTAPTERENTKPDNEDSDDGEYDPHQEEAETLQGSSPRPRNPTVLAQDSSAILEPSEGDGEETDDEDEMQPGQRMVDDVNINRGRARRRPQIVVSDEEDEREPGSDDDNFPPESAVSRSTTDFGFPSFTQRSLDLSSPRTPLGDVATASTKSKSLSRQTSISFSSPSLFSPNQRRLQVNLQGSRESSPSKNALLPAFSEGSPEKAATKSSNSVFSKLFAEQDEDELPGSASRLGGIGFKPADFGAISTQLFQTQSSPSQRASPSKRSRPSQEKKDFLANLRPNQLEDDDFMLTQTGPLGRIALNTQEVKALREADQRDVEDVLKETEEDRRERRDAGEDSTEPRWLNEAGLFTQTKPADLPWSLSQATLSQATPSFKYSHSESSLFPQSGELNAEQLLGLRSPAKTPARNKRLVRKGQLDAREYILGEELPSSPIAKPDAFKALMKPKAKKEHPAAHNEFVHGEAEESDDELQLGFSRRRTEEEEEAAIDPEEEAKMLDDRKFTEAQLREDAVVEKHMEHLAEDDAANQRLQEMAIKGQLRRNKRGHGMLDDESSDDERTARSSKYKKRRVAGPVDHLDDLDRNPEHAAFRNVYYKALDSTEEDDGFSHLNQVEDDPATDGDAEAEEVSDEEMEESDSETKPQKVSVYDVHRRIREMAEQGEDLARGNDDLQDAEEFVRTHLASSDGLLPGDYEQVEEIPFANRRAPKVQKDELDVMPPSRRLLGAGGELDKGKLASWAKEAGKGRDNGMRGSASATVTGHASAATASRQRNAGWTTASGKTGGGNAAPVRSDTMSSLHSKLGKTKSAGFE